MRAGAAASVDACAGVKGGDLVMAAKLADEHVRLLVHCLLHGTAIATKDLYGCFLKVRVRELHCGVGCTTRWCSVGAGHCSIPAGVTRLGGPPRDSRADAAY